MIAAVIAVLGLAVAALLGVLYVQSRALAGIVRERQAADVAERARLLDRIQAPDAVRAGLWPVLEREPRAPDEPAPLEDPDALIDADILGTLSEEA